jgi:hypothetical protein
MQQPPMTTAPLPYQSGKWQPRPAGSEGVLGRAKETPALVSRRDWFGPREVHEFAYAYTPCPANLLHAEMA